MRLRDPQVRRDNTGAGCSRRECLQAMGAAAIGLSTRGTALAAPVVDWREKAKKQIRLGIDANVYAEMSVAEAARRIRADGFECVLTSFNFADAKFDPARPDWQAADRITGCLQDNGVRVSSLYGYYNVVDPDTERRRRGEARMEFLIANWKRLGCPVISTETGTLNRESEWVDAPENVTEESYAQCQAAFERLARLAEPVGAIIAIEAYWQNIIRSIDHAARLLQDIPSRHLQLVMDPCNYPRKEDLPRLPAMLDEMFRRLGSRIAIAHAKDVKAAPEGTDLPAAGQGVLDYPLYLRLLAQLDRPVDLILEHLKLPDVPAARDYVLAQFDKV